MVVKHMTPYGVELDWEPLQELARRQYGESSNYCFLHWQARPRPEVGQPDRRRYGVLSVRVKSEEYVTISNNILSFTGVKGYILQVDPQYKGHVPISAIYFPKAMLLQLSDERRIGIRGEGRKEWKILPEPSSGPRRE